MSSKNPLIINWQSGNANLKSCNNSDCGINPRYSTGVSFKHTVEEGYLKIHGFDKTNQITSTGGLYYLREIYIARNSLNYYKGSVEQPEQLSDADNKAEVIMMHENSEDPNKKLYICFLLKGTDTPSTMISSQQAFDVLNNLINKSGGTSSTSWKLKKKLGENENFVMIIPKTAYNKLSGGDFYDLLKNKNDNAHEFILFPSGSETEAPNDFLQILKDKSCVWTTKHKMPEPDGSKGGNHELSDVNKGKSDFQRNNEGIGGMMSSGEIGVITECVEVVDENGTEVNYVNNNKASADWFASYSEDNGISTFLNNPQFGTTITGLAWIIIIIVSGLCIYLVLQFIGNLGKSGKKSAVPQAQVETK